MPKFLPSDPPYERYVVYGPYLSKAEGRRIVALVSPAHRTTASYAKYLLSVKLGRELLPGEEADHIDDDKLNDAIENLQVLDQKLNKQKGRSLTMIDLVCPICERAFSVRSGQMNGKKPGERCCSRRCGGIRSHQTLRGQVG